MPACGHGVALRAGPYGPSSPTSFQDPRERPSLVRRTTQDLLGSALTWLAREGRRVQGKANLDVICSILYYICSSLYVICSIIPSDFLFVHSFIVNHTLPFCFLDAIVISDNGTQMDLPHSLTRHDPGPPPTNGCLPSTCNADGALSSFLGGQLHQ